MLIFFCSVFCSKLSCTQFYKHLKYDELATSLKVICLDTTFILRSYASVHEQQLDVAKNLEQEFCNVWTSFTRWCSCHQLMSTVGIKKAEVKNSFYTNTIIKFCKGVYNNGNIFNIHRRHVDIAKKNGVNILDCLAKKWRRKLWKTFVQHSKGCLVINKSVLCSYRVVYVPFLLNNDLKFTFVKSTFWVFKIYMLF